MGNMGYCRFEHTLEDLRDCAAHIEDEHLSSEEERKCKQLIKLCREIADNFDDFDDD